MSLPSMNLLRDFPNEYYVETGVYRGDSIQQAIDSGSFKKILGLEIDYEMVRFCKDRFDLYRHPREELRVYESDTAIELGMHIRNVPSPITFFLDSHWQMVAGTDKGRHPFPLLDELKQIETMRKGQDIIIIDDLLYLTHPDVTGWSKKKIIDALLKINPKYTIRITSNPIVDNLLIAIP
jgi:hypothetical protein